MRVTGAVMPPADDNTDALAISTPSSSTEIVAVPVASPEAKAELAPLADDWVALLIPDDFRAVGQWYEDFLQTPDAEVVRLLAAARGNPTG